MNPQYSHTGLATFIRIPRLSAFMQTVIMTFVIVGFLLSPAITNVVQAADNLNASQSEVAAVGCYGVYHIVRPGQTLYSIAAAYGTTAYRIAMCNGISSYTLYVGQSLLVPTYRTR